MLGGEDGGANGVLRHAQSRLVATEEEEEEMEEEERPSRNVKEGEVRSGGEPRPKIVRDQLGGPPTSLPLSSKFQTFT